MKCTNYEASHYTEFCSIHSTFSLSDPNIFFSALFSNTCNVRLSIRAADQVLHPYKTTEI